MGDDEDSAREDLRKAKTSLGKHMTPHLTKLAEELGSFMFLDEQNAANAAEPIDYCNLFPPPLIS